MEKLIRLSNVLDILSKNQWAFTGKAFYFSLIQQLETIEPLCGYEISPLENDTEAPEVVVKYLNK